MLFGAQLHVVFLYIFVSLLKVRAWNACFQLKGHIVEN